MVHLSRSGAVRLQVKVCEFAGRLAQVGSGLRNRKPDLIGLQRSHRLGHAATACTVIASTIATRLPIQRMHGTAIELPSAL